MLSCIPGFKDVNYINRSITLNRFPHCPRKPATCQGASPSHGTYLHAATAPKEPDTKSIHHSKTTTNSAGFDLGHIVPGLDVSEPVFLLPGS